MKHKVSTPMSRQSDTTSVMFSNFKSEVFFINKTDFAMN